MKTTVLILTLSLATPGACALAGDGQVQVAQGNDTKTKVKGDRVVVSDKSKPVRRALEEQYAKIADAQRWGDIEALRALRTPDFTVTTANGQTWTRMQMMKGKRRRVETSAIQTETWVNTADGWRLKHIGNLRPGICVVDGKRVDPRRPYDPDAPPYEPGEGQPWSGSKR